MNRFSTQPSCNDKGKGSHLMGWMLGAIALASLIAALASYLTLTHPERSSQNAAASRSAITTYGAPLLHDHSVVLTQDLPDEPEVPGVSIAAYFAP
jgi:hypothetical protein